MQVAVIDKIHTNGRFLCKELYTAEADKELTIKLLKATRRRSIRQYKIKKGDRRLPKINYFCIVYVQALNP